MPQTFTSWATKLETFPDGRSIYGRVSSNRDKLSNSVANQITDGRLLFDEQEWPVVEKLIFSDDNISASEYSTKERPDFERLLAAIGAGRVWLVVVTEVARITRVMEVAVEIVKLQKGAGGLIIMTTEGKIFDLKTTTGVHDFYAAVVEASRESGTKSDRIKRNKRNVAVQGRYHGGRARYGRARAIKDQFGRVTNTGSVGVDIVEEEAEILRETLRRIVAGWPLLSIIRDLGKREVVGVSGKPFTTSVLRKTISSKHLIGMREYKGREYPGAYPAIVERPLWEKAMAMLNTQDRLKGNDRKGVRSFLLTGKIKCGNPNCGNKWSAATDNEGGRQRRTYLCRPYDNFGNKVGCYKTCIADPLEQLVIDAVLYRYSSPQFVEALRRAHTEGSASDELGRLISESQQLQSRLDELEDAYTKGTDGLDLASMLRMKSAMQGDLKKVAAKMEHHAAGKLIATIPSGGIREAFAQADLTQRRMLIDLILEDVTVSPATVKSPRVRWIHEETGQWWWFDPERVQLNFKY